MSDSKGTETILADLLDFKGIAKELGVTETKVLATLGIHAEIATALRSPANLRHPAAMATICVVLSPHGLGPLGMTFC